MPAITGGMGKVSAILRAVKSAKFYKSVEESDLLGLRPTVLRLSVWSQKNLQAFPSSNFLRFEYIGQTSTFTLSI